MQLSACLPVKCCCGGCQDLRNGFLLGEVLWRHNQLHAYDKLMIGDTADAMVASPPRPPFTHSPLLSKRRSTAYSPKPSHPPPLSLEVLASGDFLLKTPTPAPPFCHTFAVLPLGPRSCAVQVNNFCLVEPVLRTMGIKFDAQTCYGVMRGRPGAASSVLYKVR